MWKFEDGPEDAPDEGDPNDVGPAWLDTYEGDERVSSEKVANGEWITRAEAQRIAAANGYELAVDSLGVSRAGGQSSLGGASWNVP
jgi:hypothetical protein